MSAMSGMPFSLSLSIISLPFHFSVSFVPFHAPPFFFLWREQLFWESTAFTVCKMLTMGFLLPDFWVLVKDPKAGNRGCQIHQQTLAKLPEAQSMALSSELTLGCPRNLENIQRGRLSLASTLSPWDIPCKTEWEWLSRRPLRDCLWVFGIFWRFQKLTSHICLMAGA